ncbi:MAG: chorismate synthase, partial [Paludibacteraceae bacterium]|nr:chorismate synthase [Paludibacteraceae bacterium]
MNTIGQILRFTDFGESHGVAVGGVLDGVPSQMKIDFDAIQYDLDRRAG